MATPRLTQDDKQFLANMVQERINELKEQFGDYAEDFEAARNLINKVESLQGILPKLEVS